MPTNQMLPEPMTEFLHAVEFPAETFPPLRDRPTFETPTELADRRDVEVKFHKPTLSEAAGERLLATALNDPILKKLLGSSFTRIGVRKSPTKSGLESIALFYSYDNQWAVEATITGSKVVAAAFRYQPCITDDELLRAVEISRGALPNDLAGLESGAMVIERNEPDDPHAGRRLADVRFFAGDERLARFFAIVDLATNKVIEAGSVADHG